MLFAGGGGISANPNVRRSIRFECENVTTMSANGTGYEKLCQFVDCSNEICEHDPIRFMKPMLQASFCCSLRGYSTRRSTFDGILAGVHSVFFERFVREKAVQDGICQRRSIEEFSVSIPKEMCV
ncbi:hypothetical protein HAX54_013851 [Datura stramonium]|uniref:Uncharacterized protein n=1 Tax=Datura stramonium TaxID=4076 RepID=A0ABS8TNU8_DATST|nr:hypothetical protein [Datura stramonium]